MIKLKIGDKLRKDGIYTVTIVDIFEDNHGTMLKFNTGTVIELAYIEARLGTTIKKINPLLEPAISAKEAGWIMDGINKRDAIMALVELSGYSFGQVADALWVDEEEADKIKERYGL
jgi:hypothetical protein